MTPQEAAYVQQWIAKGQDDLTVANMIIEQNVAVMDVACFHCQQAVEKFLKAFLVSKQIDFPKTHNLEYLKELCMEREPTFTQLEVGDFENYAIRNRYPHDFEQPDLAEVLRLYALATSIKTFVVALL